MPAYSESNIESAINDRLNGLSMRKAAAKWGIPESTLRSRALGNQSRAGAHRDQQRLSTDKEKRLVRWILSQESLGYCPTHRQVRYIVT
ncbi:hypothetical protein TOPH_04654 [Tolypocladium ophioglossoides CBS 100239]|uniref:HTH psq-type domain-containing protein n=1 Tax=Tolypocladium ophioglossoides (strain CBS 100239) TaxID=1163406 RepID=A0A0L0N9U4_TOLOC|nr:hypothetical protein TOPH_04654 [Tolypocladium ophioglossoides CBS 100239]